MSPVQDITVPGLNGIRMWEGRALRAYQDEVGVWTIGYGVTNMDKGLGFKVGAGVTITAEQAEQLLYTTLVKNYAPAVRKAVQPERCPHPQDAQNGGLSFHFNTGGIGRASWPKDLLAGDYEACQTNLKSWCRGGGKVLNGLVRRRAWEWGVIYSGNYGHLEGPGVLDQHEREIGHGELLTALPGHPTEPVDPGSVHTDGVPVPTTPAPGALQLGSSGQAVIDLQRSLVAAGYAAPVSGTFDEATRQQVIKFQQSHPHLTADGIVGPATTAALARNALLREQAGKVAKVAPAVPATAAALWQWVSTHSAQLALIGGCAVLVIVLAYLAVTYRAVLSSMFNKVTGRVTI